jgi:hypothetical protein
VIRAQAWRSVVDKASEPGGEDGWQVDRQGAEGCAGRQTLAKGSE